MSGILGPNGQPVRNTNVELLMKVAAEHEQRLQAMAAQQIHMGIMIEFMVNQLSEVIGDFELDPEEFNSYRETRFEEMRQEATELAQARDQLNSAERELANVDLSESDDSAE